MRINNGLEKRAAIVAEGIGELIEKLRLLQERRESIDEAGIYISLGSVLGEPGLHRADKGVVQKRADKRSLARQWIRGGTIDIKQLSIKRQVPCMVLPKYAFDHNIEFKFDRESSGAGASPTESDEMFYQNILDRVVKGELSEDQFEELIEAWG
jgi:hypothetical protein